MARALSVFLALLALLAALALPPRESSASPCPSSKTRAKCVSNASAGCSWNAKKRKCVTTTSPTTKPTRKPTAKPTTAGTTASPTKPSAAPTKKPSSAVTKTPTTRSPTRNPNAPPTALGTVPAARVVVVSPTVSVYKPDMVCRPENCPATLGTCDDTTNTCTPKNGWQGLKTYPHAMATYYCELSPTGCLGVTYVNTPYVTATKAATNLGISLCSPTTAPTATCAGIVATPPLMVGNSQEAIDPATGQPVRNWGMGLTEASGVCYELTGPGGKVVVATTDRCGGYASCTGQPTKAEAGPCVNKNLTPGCPCVGTVGSVFTSCCGLTQYQCPAGALDNECDWCASQNHPHFDLDTAAFNHVCGSAGSAGSCEITSAKPVMCIEPVAWPPGSGGGGGGGGGGVSCGASSFQCPDGSPNVAQPANPDAPGCCCNWGLHPVAGTNGCA